MRQRRNCVLLTLFLLQGAASSLPIAAKRPIRYADILPELRELLHQQNISRDGFDDFVRSIEKSTAERLRLGENDHLVAYLLQSARFTRQPKIEPARSAREFVESLDREDRRRYLAGQGDYLPPPEKIPKTASRRIEEFLAVRNRPNADERLSYFQAFLKKNTGDSPLEYLRSAYARSMLFLYQKEWAAKDLAGALESATPPGADQLRRALLLDGRAADRVIEVLFHRQDC